MIQNEMAAQLTTMAIVMGVTLTMANGDKTVTAMLGMVNTDRIKTIR